jgi:hypothetical protein
VYRALACVLLICGGPLSACSLAAQTTPSPLAPGERVRITAPEWSWHRTEARLVAVETDTLVVDHPDAPGIRMGFTDVHSLEVVARPARRAGSAFTGTLLGGAAGFVLAKGYLDAKHVNDEWNSMSATFYGLLPGLLLGAGIGLSIGQERWQEIDLSDSVASAYGPAGNLSIRLSVPLP